MEGLEKESPEDHVCFPRNLGELKLPLFAFSDGSQRLRTPRPSQVPLEPFPLFGGG